MITVKEVSVITVPLPPAGKARLFLDEADGHWKIKKDTGVVVDLESGALGAVDAEAVTYATTDVLLWSWAAIVPLNAEAALDTLAGKVKDIDLLLLDLAPAKATMLSALALGVTATFYQGKLPSGLAAAWYTENAPGDVVNTVIYASNFNINAVGFHVGKKNQLATYGSLNYLLNTVITDTVDMTVSGTGTDGVLTVSAVNIVNNFWESATAQVAVVQSTEGLARYQLSHTNSGASTIVKAFREDNAVAASFSVLPVATQNTKVSKWLSGIEYYGIGSTFNVSYSIANAFRKVYKPVGLTVIALIGVNIPHTVDPSITPAYTDTFVVTNHLLTLDAANQASASPVMTVTYAKPNNISALVNSAFNIKTSLGLGICTFGTISTTVFDGLQDEAQRLNVSGLTAFVSSAVLPNGEAQVRVGSLVYGNVDYPAKTGDQSYTRYFTKAAANSGLVVFAGLNVANIAPFGTGSLNVLLILETEGKWFDFGQPFGANNGTGVGTSAANSKGARVSGSGANLAWTIGTNTTANNLNKYRILIIFKNATYSMTSLTTS